MNTKEELISKKEKFLQLKKEYNNYEDSLAFLKDKQKSIEEEKAALRIKIDNLEDKYRGNARSYYKDRRKHNRGLKILSFTLLSIGLLISSIIPNILLYSISSSLNNISLGYVGKGLLEAFYSCFYSFSPFVIMFSSFFNKKLDKIIDKILDKLNYKFLNDEKNIERLNKIKQLEKDCRLAQNELWELKNQQKDDEELMQNITNKMNEIKNKLYDVMYSDYEEVISYGEIVLEETGPTLALK